MPQRTSRVADSTDASLIVRGDHDRITQIITNLLGNALGHTQRGGTVSLRSGRVGAMAWVEITDTGSGIAPGELDRIFERFYRAPDIGAAGRPRSGRGIGLTIARSLARAHGGDVVASSGGPGTGATFRVTVPIT